MEFRILGPLEVFDGGRNLEIGGAKQRSLLAVLLLNANQTVSSDRLIECLWGAQPPANARKALQVHVSMLRKSLDGGRIVTRAPGYLIRVEPDELDLARFQSLVEHGGAEELAEALQLWHGPPLAEFEYEDFATGEIARIEELRLTTLEQRIDADLRLGRHPALVGELEALVTEQPLREQFRAQLMVALYRSGRQPEALAVYQNGSRALREELGLEPGRALQKLEKLILNQDPSLDLPVNPVTVEGEATSPPKAQAVGREGRKTVTILYTDLTAAAKTGALDPEALRGAMVRAFQEIRAALALHEGTLERTAGDSATAVFGIPVVHEDDALRAVRAALNIRERLDSIGAELESRWNARLETRIGISTGEVVASAPASGEPSATGETVNVAVRLGHAAVSGEILLADETHRLVRDAVVVEPTEQVAVETGPIKTWQLIDVTRDLPGRITRFDSPMVGRERDRRRLEDAFGQAVGDSSCQLFSVLGPAGVGKSRLVQEFLATLADRAVVARGRCLSYGEGITYWPLLEAVNEAAGLDHAESPEASRRKLAGLIDGEGDADVIVQHVSELLGLSESDGTAEQGFWAVRALLESLARRKPLVLVFDDIHWGQLPFLDLVEHVADLSREAPILLVCIARPELLEVRPDWGGGKLNATTVLLEPLSAEESAELVDNLARTIALNQETRDRIVEAADGNPLFLEEMLALVAEGETEDGEIEVPPTIQALLAARLDQLPDEERTVIEAASVEGKVFHETAVAALVPAHLRATVREYLMALLRKELIRPSRTLFSGESAFRFRHILIRDAAYEAMPKEARAVRHERYADWLAQNAGEWPPEYDEILGYHLEQAVRYRTELGLADETLQLLALRAAEHLGAAGRRAFTRSDSPAAAVKLIARAVALLPPDHPLRVELIPSVRIAQGMSADLSWAETVLREAIGAGDRRLKTHALVQQALLRLFFTDAHVTAEELLQVGEDAIEAFEEMDDDLGLARAWRLVGQARYLDRSGALSAEASLRALTYARRVGDRHEQREDVHWLVSAYLWGPCPAGEASRACEDVLREVSGDPVMEVTLLSALGILAAMQGMFAEANELHARCRRIVDDLGQWVWVLPTNAGYVALARDDPAGAEKELRPAYEAIGQVGERGHFSAITMVLAQAVYRLGRYEEAEELTQETEQLSGANDIQCQTMWRSTRSKALARRGDLGAAELLAREALAFVQASDFHVVHADALMDLADVLRLAGRPAEAAAALREAAVLDERKGDVVSKARALALLDELSA